MIEKDTQAASANARYSRWLWLALIVALLLRLPSFSLPIWILDEAAIATAADAIVSGGVYYRDAVGHRGPLTPYLYAGVFAATGRYNMFALRVVLTLLVVILTALVWRMGSRAGGSVTAAAAALLFAVLASISHPASDLFAFNTEWPLVLGSLAGGTLLLMRLSGGAGHWASAAAGVCFAAGFLSRQSCAFDCLAVVVLCLILVGHALRQGDRARMVFLALTFGIIGFVFLVVVGVVGLAFWRVGALSEAVFGFWRYNLEYYTVGMTVAQRVASMPHTAWAAGKPAGIGLLALAGVAIVLARRHARSKLISKEGTAQLFIVLWAVFAFLGSTLPGRVHGHYYIQLLAPWCLLAGIVFSHVHEVSSGKRYRIAYSMLVGSVLIGLVPLIWMVLPTNLAMQQRWSVDTPTEWLARYIHDTTEGTDKIFVWGFYPHPYALARRSAASRYSYCSFITGANAGGKVVPGAIENLMQDLEGDPPRLIVDTAPGDYFHWGQYPVRDFPALADFIAAKYERDYRIRRHDGWVFFNIYRLRDGGASP
ncbi:MAG: hypothetical protein GY906_32155 [bacterium]|nr:hypothetical protein [bacterium]